MGATLTWTVLVACPKTGVHQNVKVQAFDMATAEQMARNMTGMVVKGVFRA